MRTSMILLTPPRHPWGINEICTYASCSQVRACLRGLHAAPGHGELLEMLTKAQHARLSALAALAAVCACPRPALLAYKALHNKDALHIMH